jgi:hypothetical protein
MLIGFIVPNFAVLAFFAVVLDFFSTVFAALSCLVLAAFFTVSCLTVDLDFVSAAIGPLTKKAQQINSVAIYIESI